MIRVDRGELPRVQKTGEGYLRGDAVVTRTGVFTYRNDDGTLRRELRHPDDVLRAESLSTLRMIPMTVMHPNVLLNADNAKELSVGMTGDSYNVDGANIRTPITITHKDGVGAVESGMMELSLGYEVDLVEEQGIYNGQPYDYRQTDIVYNHLAIVPVARAGQAARINLDGAAVLSDENPQGDGNMKKVNIDGIEYEAAPEVANKLEREAQRADTAEQTVKTVTSEKDGLQAKLDAAEQEKAELQTKLDNLPNELAEKAKERNALEKEAMGVLPKETNLDGLSDSEVRVAVIKSVRGDGFDPTDKPDGYIMGAYEAALSTVATRKDSGAGQVVKSTPVAPAARGDGEGKDHRKDAQDAITSMWKGKESK